MMESRPRWLGEITADAVCTAALLALLLLTPGSEVAACMLGLLLITSALYDPTWPLVTIAAASALTPAALPPITAVQQFSIRWQDVALAALLTALAIRWRRRSERLSIPGGVHAVMLMLTIFVSYAGCTLFLVQLEAPDRVAAAIASHARLAESALLAPVVLIALGDRRAASRLSSRLLILGVALVVLAVAGVYEGNLMSERTRADGMVGTGTIGLIGALLCLAATLGAGERSLPAPLAIIVLSAGAAGLFVSKSAISALAFCASASLYAVLRQRRRDLLTPVILAASLVVACVVGLIAIRILRPSDFDGLISLTGGSFTHRLLVGAGGLWLLLQSPVLGLGWQMSLSPDLLRDPALTASMMTWFPAVPRHYLPDTSPTSLHNLYLQAAVELGTLGLAILIALVASVARMSRMALSTSPDGISIFHAYALVLLMLWWNSSALWGGQIESFLVFVSIGILAVLARDARTV